LVVIAIIGLLSSIVFASLSTARRKAKDAAIKGEMLQLRTEAELGYDISLGTHKAAICIATSPGGFASILYYSINQKTPVPGQSISCGQNAPQSPPTGATAWGVAVNLNDGTTFCVDSTGYAGPSTQIADDEIQESFGAFFFNPSNDVTCNNQ